MANTNCNIDNGTPPTMSCGQVTLNYNDTLTLGIGTGFTNPTTTSITQVNFYNSVNVYTSLFYLFSYYNWLD